ncbi:FUSC family protein [Actinopolymorpha alba]|uniref:FUSC family protein n=1 Tax=Actinopolymorpha alba TaxID=533267 RepID=UPI00192B11EA|nr:FUSC family protein [Actinopolymorpha alba]
MPGRKPMAALMRRGEAILDDAAQRSRESLRTRFGRLRRTLVPIIQSAAAAGLAWLIATRVVGHPQPFFAPIAAVLSLGVSLGQRLRRSVELIVGVALGILVADLLIGVIGRGAWQISLVVFLAMAGAVLLGGGPLLVNQGAASAVLLVALVPATSTGAAATSRFVDALTGGAVGLLVNAILLPTNPIVIARRAANPVIDELAGTLEDIANALELHSREAASAALSRARRIEGSLGELRDALAAGSEIARIAPVRWRTRGHLFWYVDAAPHLDHAVRNVRVLARRALVVIRVGESVDPRLPLAIRRLAEAVRTLRNELAKGTEPLATRRGLLDAAQMATATLGSLGFSGNVIVAQIRSAAADLLQATGVERADIDKIFASGGSPGPGPGPGSGAT